jgi:hypothetical protein
MTHSLLMRKLDIVLSVVISPSETGVQATAISSLAELSLEASRYWAELPTATRPSILRWSRGNNVRQSGESDVRPRPPIWRATTLSSCGTLESTGMLTCARTVQSSCPDSPQRNERGRLTIPFQTCGNPSKTTCGSGREAGPVASLSLSFSLSFSSSS